jgi:hypothetical protein
MFIDSQRLVGKATLLDMEMVEARRLAQRASGLWRQQASASAGKSRNNYVFFY